ncbi:BnaA04g27830D [Brassica napus]|uniref:BnaA04g27830D protein n=1 Tax=Brassica napus TaxID=3708 RepID=A0A078JMQ3_BRANA|nr:BnaA04g27830D [Brassica napus]
MGCASSKHKRRCSDCRGGLSPVVVPRSYSMHVHHPPQHSGDSHHTVALTSSTVGSLTLCECPFSHIDKHLEGVREKRVVSDEKKLIPGDGFHQDDLETEKLLQSKLMEAKVWSSMMNQRIPKLLPPKTPIVTPPGEPETINTWELMEGLEDACPLRPPDHLRSFSFDVVRVQPCDDGPAPFDRPKSRFHDLDPPEIVSSFRKSLQELPDDHPFHIRIPNPEKVIVYFTSLRGIRKTYEDGCNVRVILKSLGIRLDERDVSMHSGFKDELKELLRDEFNGGVGITLPRVFLGSKYLGGLHPKKLNENGTLEKVVDGCERVEDGLTGCGIDCEACGDVRFVPCETCSGSCKIYYDKETEYGFQRCPDCNENGLVRCPICCG